jgi:hypothetical protein
MDTTFFSLLLGVLIVLSLLIRLTAPLRQQENTQQDTNEKRWCYGCDAWMRDVEQYWYKEEGTRVMSYLCPDCAFERKAIAVDEDGFPLEPLL